jgi:Rab-GTPase-TBC domain
MRISGASTRKQKQGSQYFEGCLAAMASRPDDICVKQIDLDLTRTFPEHAYFQGGEGLAKLRGALMAYAAHNPAIGYCQSMNYVAGLLLLVLDRDAESVFWVLSALIEGTQRSLMNDHVCIGCCAGTGPQVHLGHSWPLFWCCLRTSVLACASPAHRARLTRRKVADKLAAKTYDEQISGCHVEVKVFEGLLQKKMPALHRHLVKHDVALLAIIPQWFLSLFTQACPPEVGFGITCSDAAKYASAGLHSYAQRHRHTTCGKSQQSAL